MVSEQQSIKKQYLELIVEKDFSKWKGWVRVFLLCFDLLNKNLAIGDSFRRTFYIVAPGAVPRLNVNRDNYCTYP